MTGDRQSLATGSRYRPLRTSFSTLAEIAVANHSKNFLQVPALIGAMEKFFHKEHGTGIPCAVGANESTCRMSLKNLPGSR
jgi:hypothetical protein